MDANFAEQERQSKEAGAPWLPSGVACMVWARRSPASLLVASFSTFLAEARQRAAAERARRMSQAVDVEAATA